MRRLVITGLIVTVAMLGIVYFQQHFVQEDRQKPVTTVFSNSGQAIKQTKQKSQNDAIFLYQLIGKDVENVKKLLGEPKRVDMSEYDYDWWIYNEPLSRYCQIGIEAGKVVSVFVMGNEVDIRPFKLGQSRAEIEAITDIKDKIEFEVDQNFYRFELTADELETTPLVQLKNNVWAQIFIDKFSDTLSSVRFIDSKTLVKLRPFELVYRGELLSANEIEMEKLKQIEAGEAMQILDMTNIIRERNGLDYVNWDEETAIVAFNHSKEMFEKEYFSHRSPIEGGLSDRLIKGGVMFKVAGENIAARYVDAISAVEGWQNSEGHRMTLLNKEFTHLGVGVYEKYYTQNFYQAW
ncbi:CAP domain-containing protein [Calidifontibacillus oryziterrae]|uniref:CAP domain-containing protein n=1 Tax=Calidifontibacillus oryziterrae TaxID=1191699 RepID=UPI00030D2AA0|nr:CAP domain-containing protein [Calidifontibacillus oryziterrae]